MKDYKQYLASAVDVKELSPLTQITLDKLITGKTKKGNVSNLKYNRKQSGKHTEAFQLGLAIYLYTLLNEFMAD